MTAVVEGGGGERASFAFPKDAPKVPGGQETSLSGKYDVVERKRR